MDLGLANESLRCWVRQARIDAGHGPDSALTRAEPEELRRLPREVATLRLEHEIPKQAVAYFAEKTA